MNCSYCSALLPEGVLFCGECGRSVTVEQLLSDRQLREYIPTPETAETHALVQPDASGPVPDNFDTGTMEHVRLEALEIAREAARAEELSELSGRKGAAESGLGIFDELEAQSWPAPVRVPVPAVGSAPQMERSCDHCGATVVPGDIFCGECGAVVPVASNEVPVTAAIPELGSVTPAPTTPAPASPSGISFVLQFSTGESFTVSGTGLIGRNPQPEPGEYFDQVVRVIDPGRSVSKTHLEFGQTEGEMWIHDRYSGNGTIIHAPQGKAVRCRPEKRYRITRGTRIEIGDQFFVVN